MQLTKATTKKTYELEKTPVCRLMSQGIKLSQEVVDRMGFDVNADNRNINYAIDTEEGSATEGTIFLYADAEGRTIGKNNCFVNSGLKADMLTRANKPGFDVKGGNQVHFIVGEGVEADGTSYFPLTFSKVVEASNEEVAEETTTEASAPAEGF